MNRPDVLGTMTTVAIASAATLGTALLARSGRISGWPLVALATAAVAAAWFVRSRYLQGGPDDDRDTIDISDWGARHYRNDFIQAAIAWTDLEEVLGVTAADGDTDETLFLVLNGTSGASLTVPHAVAVESGLLHELEQHFATCDTTSFYDAALRHGTQVFILWRAERAAMHTPASLDWQIRKRNDLAS